MSHPTPTEESAVQTAPTPRRCLIGALVSGGLAIAFYRLTIAIAQTFAAKPLHSHNPMVVNIGSAVRTLVVGISTLATSLFGIVTIGLIALTIQLIIQRLTKRSSTDLPN